MLLNVYLLTCDDVKEEKNNTQVFLSRRYSSFLLEHMRMPMKQCPMKMPGVDRLVLTAREEPLMEHSGPALQAVSWKK